MSRKFIVKRTHHNDDKTFYFEMVDNEILAFFSLNVAKIKHYCIKVCKKKNLTCVLGMDRKICPSGHSLESHNEPCNAKL